MGYRLFLARDITKTEPKNWHIANRVFGGLHMKIVKMIINNYRQFDKAELDFDDNVNYSRGKQQWKDTFELINWMLSWQPFDYLQV